jgi:hypothetical protein
MDWMRKHYEDPQPFGVWVGDWSGDHLVTNQKCYTLACDLDMGLLRAMTWLDPVPSLPHTSWWRNKKNYMNSCNCCDGRVNDLVNQYSKLSAGHVSVMSLCVLQLDTWHQNRKVSSRNGGAWRHHRDWHGATDSGYYNKDTGKRLLALQAWT